MGSYFITQTIYMSIIIQSILSSDDLSIPGTPESETFSAPSELNIKHELLFLAN